MSLPAIIIKDPLLPPTSQRHNPQPTPINPCKTQKQQAKRKAQANSKAMQQQQQKQQQTNPFQPQPLPTPYEARLHAAYARLTFKCSSVANNDHMVDPVDARRALLFRRLVLHHLLERSMYTIYDWRVAEAQQSWVYEFLQAYAKKLWPGKVAERFHLASPALQPRTTRSFVGAIDSHWSARRNGPKGKPKALLLDAQTFSMEEQSKLLDKSETPIGFDCDSQIGGMALSSLGKALTQYVDVLLEPGLASAQVEDVVLLVEGIVSTEIGPEVEVEVKGLGEVMVKIEEDSE